MIDQGVYRFPMCTFEIIIVLLHHYIHLECYMCSTLVIIKFAIFDYNVCCKLDYKSRLAQYTEIKK